MNPLEKNDHESSGTNTESNDLQIASSINIPKATRYSNLVNGGVQKSGTSWLLRTLNLRSDFSMSSKKELDFCNRVQRCSDQRAFDVYP